MSRDDAVLLDLARAAEFIVKFTQNISRDEFLGDPKTQFAVLHQFMVLGEAAKRLTPEFIDRHSQIQWPPIARMRDRLIHAYDKVDLDIVLDTAKNHIPSLLSALKPLLPTEK